MKVAAVAVFEVNSVNNIILITHITIIKSIEIPDKFPLNIPIHAANPEEFITDARMRRNLRMRGQQEELKCDQCDFTTTSKTHLDKHTRSDHKKDTFNCDQCDFTATSKSHLDKHMVNYHKNDTLICDKAFSLE